MEVLTEKLAHSFFDCSPFGNAQGVIYPFVGHSQTNIQRDFHASDAIRTRRVPHGNLFTTRSFTVGRSASVHALLPVQHRRTIGVQKSTRDGHRFKSIDRHNVWTLKSTGSPAKRIPRDGASPFTPCHYSLW